MKWLECLLGVAATAFIVSSFLPTNLKLNQLSY
jgi:hypothetical protein